MDIEDILLVGFIAMLLLRQSNASAAAISSQQAQSTSVLGKLLQGLKSNGSSGSKSPFGSSGNSGNGGSLGSFGGPQDYSGYNWQGWVSDLSAEGNSAGSMPDGSTADNGSSSTGYIDPVAAPDPSSILYDGNFQPDPSSSGGAGDGGDAISSVDGGTDVPAVDLTDYGSMDAGYDSGD